MKRIPILLLLAVFLLPAVFFGCSAPESGTVTLNITDAPTDADNIESVVITITGLSYHTVDPDEWVDVADFGSPKSYDLLGLTGGVQEMLGQFILPAGEISQLRFFLDAPEMGTGVPGGGNPSSPGCYVLLSGAADPEPLFVPSGSSSGFKATGAFSVPVNGSVTLTADFDARKSVKKTNAVYNLQPTIRLIVDGEAGVISGTITLAAAVTNSLAVFAYADNTYSAAEVSADPAFSSAVSSAIAGAGLTYSIPFLAAGVYDLAVTEIDVNGGYVNTGLKTVEDITVTAGETVTADITY
ncbi:MAG: DUF4382 domain-containing protein [Spirochaetales bacterium]|nr:MAG: DUF4382 domain-containing protein [Spirochaetales bacterium]